MTKLSLRVQSKGPGTPSTKVLAQMFTRSAIGDAGSRRMVLDIGQTTTLDVDPGHVVVQLRMPSGEVMTDERTIESGHDAKMSFDLKGSRHDWLGWQQLVSQEASCDPPGKDALESIPEVLVESVRLHRSGQQTLELPLDRRTTEGSSHFAIHSDDAAMSLTIEGYTGGRAVVEFVRPGDHHEVVVPPLPWLDDSSSPVTIQLLLERCAEGARASVVIQEPMFSSVLAYYASGDRTATNDLAPMVEAHARQAIMGKFQNPCAAAAAVLVLRRMLNTTLPISWLENLAEITTISDGAILYATHLMETRDRRSDRERIRRYFLEARRRGVPVFSECGRMLHAGLRRLAAGESADEEVTGAAAWARDLVDASRSDTMFSWLVSDLPMLSRLVPEVTPAPSNTAPPPMAVAQH